MSEQAWNRSERVASVRSLPKLSVITVCYNSRATLRETIESVMGQNYPNLEHIIIDGGSTDGTLDLIREYPHLIWKSEKDKGIYDAMNKGLRQASGDYLGVLNSDDCYRDGALLKVGAAFVEHPGWDALFGDIVYVDGEGKEIFRRREACYDYDVLRFTGICYVIHPTLFVRRSVYEGLGYYREKEFFSAADYELILRLGQRGYEVGQVPEFLANFRFHERSQSSDVRIIANTHREALRIIKEHGFPGGWRGALLKAVMRVKRQVQKLAYRGSCDLLPANWLLSRRRQNSGKLSTNVPLDQLHSSTSKMS